MTVSTSHRALAIGEPAASARTTQLEYTVEPGQYWEYRGNAPLRTIEPGDVLLIAEVKEHEHAIHTVVVRDHPKRDRHNSSSYISMLAGEFFSQWTPTDGEAVRAREMDAIERRIRDEELAIEHLERTAGRAALEHSGVAATDSSQALATIDHRRKAIQTSQGKMQLAAQRIEEAVKELIPYRQERIEAVKARHQRALAHVKAADDALELLDLYAGSTVEIEHWTQGTPADPDEPVTVFQRTRFVDRESLLRILERNEDGADIRDVQTFIEQLARDETLQRRITPTPRCIVALQPRSDSKRYAELLDALRYSTDNETTFLLIRNGERFTTLHYPMGARPRLIPRRDEWSRTFREDNDRWWRRSSGNDTDPGWIGPDDVRFVDTVRRAESAMRGYLKAWIAIAGAHLREQILAPLAIEIERNEPLNLLRPDHHDLVVRIVRDEEDALDVDLEDWDEYLERHNAQIRTGGRIVIRAHSAIENEGQDAWYRYDNFSHSHRLKTRPSAQRPEILPVRRNANGQWHVRVLAENGRHLPITLDPEHDCNWLWFEECDPATLRRYIDFRRERYADIAPLAIIAEQQLLHERTIVGTDANDNCPFELARRMLRSLKGGRTPPERHVRSLARALRTPSATLSRTVTTMFAPETFIAIAVQPNGQLLAYARAHGREGRCAGLPWAHAHPVRFTRGTTTPTVLPPIRLGTVPRGPWVVAPKTELDELDTELRCLDWNEADTIERAVTDTARGFRLWTERIARDEKLQAAIVEGAVDYGVADGRYRHGNGLLWWPTGVVRRAKLRNGHREAWVIGVACDAFALVCRYGADTGRRRATKRIHRIYVSGDFHVRNTLAEAQRSEREMGEWYIAPAGIALPSAERWTPLWIEPKGSLAKQWKYSSRRQNLAVDAANALHVKGRTRQDDHPPRVVLWTPGDDPA